MLTGLLNITKGCSFSYNFNAQDISGNNINMSGLSGFAPLKLKFGDSGILDQFNFNILNTGSGYCNISLSPAQTTNYPVTQGIYEIDVFNYFNIGSYQQIVAQGYININPELLPGFTGIIDGGNFDYTVLDGGVF